MIIHVHFNKISVTEKIVSFSQIVLKLYVKTWISDQQKKPHKLCKGPSMEHYIFLYIQLLDIKLTTVIG